MRMFNSLIYYNLHAANAVLTKDNELDVFTDGLLLYEDLKNEIENASKYIHILSYIIKPDEVLEGLETLLERKVKQGVRVRFLTDAVGSRSMKKEDYRRMKKKGIWTAEFFPAVFGKFQPRLNYRNHRKIIVIDGRIGYVGGFNFAREYLGKNPRIGYWRDTHLKIRGGAVEALNRRFVLDWNYAAKDQLTVPGRRPASKKNADRGQVPIQIITSGPGSRWQNIRNNYLRLFQLARKHIYIQTPYFVPDEPTMHALQLAALSGVDVRLMIPCKPDHAFVYWASCSYAARLLEAGVKCYTYNNGFLHAKGVTVDGLVCCYGTANMDIRSFRLNYEVNAVIYDERIAGQMEEIFLKDLKDCTEITQELYDSRKWLIRLKEKISCVLSPVL